MINIPVIQKWVKALRSGAYQQGRNRLHSVQGDTYCCLGVLCAIAANEGVVEETSNGTAYRYAGDVNYLPLVVQQWAGLDNRDPSFPLCGIAGSLAKMNDRGEDFSAIAEVIEKSLLTPEIEANDSHN